MKKTPDKAEILAAISVDIQESLKDLFHLFNTLIKEIDDLKNNQKSE